MTVPPNDAPREPSHDPAHDDELFRQIVAGFAEDASDPVPRWPVSEDLDRSAPPSPAALPLEQAAVEPLPGWVEPAALEDEGHYVPPPPPRLPRIRLRTVLGVLILLAGLISLLTPSLVGLDDSALSLLLGMAVTVGGAVLLVSAVRDAPGSNNGPDDGAVV